MNTGANTPPANAGRLEKVKEIIALTKWRTRQEIEEALDQHVQHHPMGKWNEHAE